MKIINTTEEIIIASEPKQCGCCKRIFKVIPLNSRLAIENGPFDGYYWECTCRSTLVYPLGRLYRVKTEDLPNVKIA